jgi:ribosomal protein S12 methylthiotransferase
MKSRRKQEMVTVGFVALGCPKNIVDSEKMLAEIGESGFVLSGDPDNADVVVINTCGFIAPAKEEALEAIRQAVRRKKKGRVGRVVVCGCLSERMGEALLEEVDGIDAVVGLGQRAVIGDIIKDVVAQRGKAEERSRIYLGEGGGGLLDDRGRLLITPAHWAYLRISEGCDRKCSFCTIPSIRGRFRSKDPEIVLAEARELVANGAVELSLIAQDSNYYLRDRGIRGGLVKLIDQLAAIDGLAWIRLMYLYPATIDDELIAAIAAQPKVVHYVDMPIQHINDAILKRMRRADRKDTTIRLIEKLRAAMPDVVLRTTVITGFPGETEEAFEELLEFVRWAKFEALGCFPFYAEPGTHAATLDGQVPQDVRHARADRLMRMQQEIAFAAARARIGQRLQCLVDASDEEQAEGRFYGQAPHTDSICRMQGPAEPGQFVPVRVVDTQDYDLIVSRI